MSLFPFVDGSVKIEDSTTELPVPKEYAWDFINNDFALKNGKHVIVEGIEAIKVWVYKALQTERYKYLAYSWNYGVELESFMKNINLSALARKIEIKRLIEEALSINPYINRITNFSAEIVDDVLSTTFTVVTSYGEVNISV